MLVSKQRDKISLFRHELSSWRNFVVILHFLEPTICSFSKKKKRQMKMFETTAEIFSLVFFICFVFYFSSLGQSSSSVFQRAQFK